MKDVTTWSPVWLTIPEAAGANTESQSSVDASQREDALTASVRRQDSHLQIYVPVDVKSEIQTQYPVFIQVVCMTVVILVNSTALTFGLEEHLL